MNSHKSWSHKMMLCHGACLWNLNVSFCWTATISQWLALFYLCFLFPQMPLPSIFLLLETLWNNDSLFLASMCQGTGSTISQWSQGSIISEINGVTANTVMLTDLKATPFYQTRGTLKLLCFKQFLTWSGWHRKIHTVSVNHGYWILIMDNGFITLQSPPILNGWG